MLVLIAVSQLFAATVCASKAITAEYGDYYYNYDFENYESGGFATFAEYFHSTEVTTKDGLICNAYGDTTFNSTPGGETVVITDEESGNKYLRVTFNKSGTGNRRIGSFPLGTEIIGNAVAIDFKFRANGTDTDTDKMNLIQLRRGTNSGNYLIQVDGCGNIYMLNTSISKSTPIYTQQGDEFMDISLRWYDVTNSISLYINGKTVLESVDLSADLRADTVIKTWNDSFIAEKYELNNTTMASVQLCSNNQSYSWSFDMDDLRIYDIATPEEKPYYYENHFDYDGINAVTDSTRSDSNRETNSYVYASGNSGITKAADADGNGYAAFSGGDWMALTDKKYQILSTTSWVMEFDIKAAHNEKNFDKETNKEVVYRIPLIRFNDGGLNQTDTLYIDANGNLFLEDRDDAFAGGVKLSMDEWTHIAVVCVNDMTNVGKFGSFNSSTDASAVNLTRTFAVYADGKFIGTTNPQTVYLWKNNASTSRTLNGYDIDSITTVTVETDGLDTSDLTVVDSTTTANHTIYKKSVDGTVYYYDVEYTDSAKTTQKTYSTMTLTSSNVGGRGEWLGIFNPTFSSYQEDAESTDQQTISSLTGALDNLVIYEGNYPAFMTENTYNEQNGILLDMDFGNYVFARSSTMVAENTNGGETFGIQTEGSFRSSALKYDVSGKLISSESGNYADAYYASVSASKGYADVWLPVSGTGVYAFEHTLKNVMPSAAGKKIGFFTIRRENVVNSQNSNTTSQSLIQAYRNEDGTVQLYTNYYDTNGGQPLYNKDGTPALLKSNTWQTIKVVYDESFKVNATKTLLSYYLDGSLLYLDTEGQVPAENIAKSINIQSKKGTPNQRVRYLNSGISSGTLDLKSFTVTAVGEKKAVMTELETDAPLKNGVTVIETEIGFTPYSTSTDSYYPLVMLTRTDTNTTRELGLVYTEVNDGQLYIKNTDGEYEKLYDDVGNALKLSAESVSVAIVYDDVTGMARYYVDGCLPYIGDEMTAASDVQVSDLGFYRMEANTESIKLISKTAEGLAVDITALAYSINYSGTAEIVAMQQGEVTSDIRLLAGIDNPYYGTVGFEFEVVINGASKGIKHLSSPYIYSCIYEDGETDPIYANTEYGYNYFATASITDIPASIPANSYIYARPFTTVNGFKTYGEVAKILLSDTGHSFDEAYDEKFVIDNGDLFECSEIESYEGNGLAFNNQGAIFNFNADCAGKVYISLDSSRGLANITESVFELTVDGNTTEIRLPIGRNHILLAEVEEGNHAFSLKKISGGDFVRINSVTLDGTYTETSLTAVENGVTVKVSEPTSGNSYGNVTVYVKTTDESGKYYVEYPFLYQKNTNTNPYEGDWSNSDSANKQYNVNMYRINKGYITEKNGDSFTRLYQVLQNGEIGIALRETGVQDDGITEYKQAGDAVGGFHGDENITEAPIFTLDGVTIELGASGTYTGTTLEFVQNSIIDRCNSTNENVAEHSQIYKIDTNGIRVKRSLEFLTSDFVAMKGRSYLQMFTFVRQDIMQMDKNAVSTINYSAADLSNTVRLLDAAGNVLHTVDTKNFNVTHADGSVTPFPEDSVTNGVIVKEYKLHGNDVDNRYAEYIGDNNNGIYAKVGFNIVDASTKVDSACISVRKSIFDPAEVDPNSTTLTSGNHGDNKWYPSFTSVNDPYVCQDTVGTESSTNDKVYVPHKGETWSADMIYYIDYNPTT